MRNGAHSAARRGFHDEPRKKTHEHQRGDEHDALAGGNSDAQAAIVQLSLGIIHRAFGGGAIAAQLHQMWRIVFLRFRECINIGGQLVVSGFLRIEHLLQCGIGTG